MALWLLLLRLLLLCKGGQLFPNVHAVVTLAWFPNNNNVTQTFHRSKSDRNITLAGKEGVFGNVFLERLEHLLHDTLRYEEGVFTLVPNWFDSIPLFLSR